MQASKTGLLATILFAVSGAAFAAEPFRLTSPGLDDNAVMPQRMGGAAASNKNCLGQNVSPALAWNRGPEGTKSYVITMVDSAGFFGQGADHWIAYGIPASVEKFDEGQVSKPQPFVVVGKNSPNTDAYFGPCPSPGTGHHHYMFTMVATDLEPDALKPGLTRAELLKAIAGHGKASAGLVLRMGYPE